MSKSAKTTLTVLIGIAAIVLAIVCFSMDIGDRESYITYGGDAYTGIQNAAAQTANNLLRLCSIAKMGFGSVLMVFGLYLIVSAIQLREEPAAVIPDPSAETETVYSETL